MSRSTLRPESLPGGRLARAAQAAAAAAPDTKPGKKTAAPAASKGSGEIRIIGGQWKRTRLAVAQRPGLRPTPDRVRETLFNWLGQDLTGWHCLDAFAGTGALGLEAASRGAAAVRLAPTVVRVQRGDGVAAIKHAAPASLHLVLVDPPFDSALFEPALQAAAQAVAADGYVYLEAPTAWTDEALAPFGLTVHRHLKAGAVHAHLLQRRPKD